MPYPNKYQWSPKNSWLFGMFAFLVMLVFNKAEYKIRFLDWASGLFIIFLIGAFFGLRKRIDKREFYVIGVPLLWTVYALLATPFVVDKALHLEKLFQVMLINLIAVFSIIVVFSREDKFPQAVLLTVSVWTLVSLSFFLAWATDFFVYEKGNFAGIFKNRNEYAVQTVFLVSMMIFFVKNKLIKLLMLLLSSIMIVASLSTKGFLFFIFVLFFPLFLKVRFKRKIAVVASGLLVFVAAYTLLPNIQQRLDRFSLAITNPDELREGESAFLRLWLTVEGVKVAVKNPVFGVGVDNSRLVLIPPLHQVRGADEGLYSHNNYIEMLLNAGLLGFILYYIPILYIYYKVSRYHPYSIEIKTFSAFFLLVGVAMVQYNNFSMIMLYSLIVFLYVYYRGASKIEESFIRYKHT